MAGIDNLRTPTTEEAREIGRKGVIGMDKDLDMMSDYICEFNKKSVIIAKKYGVRPKKFSFAAFCR